MSIFYVVDWSVLTWICWDTWYFVSFVGSVGSTGLSGFPSLSFGVNPGTYGNVSVGLPGFVGSSGLFGYLIGFVGCSWNIWNP